jgi:hypothetical protein
MIVLEISSQITNPPLSKTFSSGTGTSTLKYNSSPASWLVNSTQNDYYVLKSSAFAEVWFYDDGSSNSYAYVEFMNGGAVMQHRIGLKGDTRYWFEANSAWGTNSSTQILRTVGWHKIIADYTNNTTITYYIDGVLFKQITNLLASDNKNIHAIRVNKLPTSGGYTASYIDDIIVYDVAAKPLAKKLQIKGTLALGQTLTGSYEYSDANGDVENGSSYRWLRATSLSGPWTQISNGTTTASAGATYTVQAEDIGKYVAFEITPKNVPLGLYRTGALYDTPNTSTNIGTPQTKTTAVVYNLSLQFGVAQLTANTPVTATAQLTKTTATNEDYILILAVYNGNKLYNIATQQKTVIGTTPQSFLASSIALPSIITNFKAKAFIWNGINFNTLIPFSQPIQLNSN